MNCTPTFSVFVPEGNSRVAHDVNWQRQQQGYPYRPDVSGAEQFAEDYALRWRNLMALK